MKERTRTLMALGISSDMNSGDKRSERNRSTERKGRKRNEQRTNGGDGQYRVV